MRRLFDVLRSLALIAAVVALAGVAMLEAMIAREIPKGAFHDLPAILASAESGAANFDAASQSINSAAKDQSASLKEELAEFRKATAKVNDFVGHLDVSVNGTRNHPETGLISATTRAAADQNSELLALEKKTVNAIGDLDDSVLKSEAVIENLNRTAESLKQLAADPQLTDSLAQLDTAIKKGNDILVKFDAGAATADAMMASGDDMMTMLDARLKQALKPASLAKSILERLLGLAGPIAEVGLAVSNAK